MELYIAMLSGQTIKSVYVVPGQVNKKNVSAHYEIKNFRVIEYQENASAFLHTPVDLVITDKEGKERNFFIHWVQTYEI